MRFTSKARVIFLTFFFILLLPAVVLGKEKSKTVIDTNKNMVISYGMIEWNKDSTKIDTGYILIRDRKSGKTAQVALDETEPDSSNFSGIFNVVWASKGTSSVQIFVPPQDIMTKKNGFRALRKLIANKKLKSKPFIYKLDDKGRQVIDVYDTKDQAKSALTSYAKKVKVEKEKKILPPEKLANEAILEAEILAKVKAAEKKRQEEELKREQERIRLEQIERQKAEERKKALERLKKLEIELRKAQAEQFAQAGRDFFLVGNFKESVRDFAKAVDLNPEDKSYYYMYGVALYRNANYNKSLVILKLAGSGNFDPQEKNYYIGLNHFQLQELNLAYDTFQKVRLSKHKSLAPASAFYQGLIRFTQTQYEEAKPFFEEVLDTSADPKLDDQAESYIERILRLLHFAKNKRNDFYLSFTSGFIYDTNILLISDSTIDQSTPTNRAGGRALASGSLHWHPIYDKNYEAGLKLDSSYMYSLDSTFSQADPFTVSLKLPLVYKDVIWDKGVQISLVPGYENLFLDGTGDGTRDNYFNSVLGDLLTTIAYSDSWFASYNLKYRNDVALVNADVATTKITFNLGNTFFFNKSKTRGLITNINFISNNAVGNNYKFTRYEFTGTYMMPWIWDTMFTGTLGAYSVNYPDHSSSRKDTNINAALGLNRPLYDWLRAVFSLGYIYNASNVDSNDYNKINVTLLFSSETRF